MAAAMAGGAAAAALRLGPRSRELAVLELAELEKGVVNTAAPSDDGPPIVETDLALQDVSSDEEFYKRSKAWFNLLPLRKNFFLEAKRPCVICLTEKEHTLVPPHAPPRNAPNVPSEAVEDHRFCTDCWEDFLRHRTSTTSSMTCPVCHGEIIIPEVWTQRLQLPQRWSQEEAPASALLPMPVVTVPRYERSRWLFRPVEASLWAWQRMGSCLGRGQEISLLYEELDPRTARRRWWRGYAGLLGAALLLLVIGLAMLLWMLWLRNRQLPATGKIGTDPA